VLIRMIKDHNQPFPFIKSEEKESILCEGILQ